MFWCLFGELIGHAGRDELARKEELEWLFGADPGPHRWGVRGSSVRRTGLLGGEPGAHR